MRLSSKKVIVTGANGLVGSNLIERLLQKGYMVYVVVRDAKLDISRTPSSKNVHLVMWN